MIHEHNSLGMSGLYWFVGVVENRHDPLKVGRVQVRCHHWHSEVKTDIKTSDLHWAIAGGSTENANTSGVSRTSRLVEGTWVYGFFLDGIEGQHPLVMGTIPGVPQFVANSSIGFNDPGPSTNRPKKANLTFSSTGTPVVISNTDQGTFPRSTRLDEPDLSRLTRNEATPDQIAVRRTLQQLQVSVPTAGHVSAGGSDSAVPQGSFSEPAVPYAAVYPYNDATETESGHAVELDDTPTAERIHIYHRSGSFVEFRPDGSTVQTTTGHEFTFVHGNSNRHVDGSQNITIDKGFNLLVSADGEGGFNLDIGSGVPLNITTRGGNLNISVNGDLNQTVTGNVNQTVGGNVVQTVTGSVDETAASHTINAPTTINGTLTVNGAQTNSSTIVASGDVVGAGISLSTHVHSGVQSGPSVTGPPS